MNRRFEKKTAAPPRLSCETGAGEPLFVLFGRSILQQRIKLRILAAKAFLQRG